MDGWMDGCQLGLLGASREIFGEREGVRRERDSLRVFSCLQLVSCIILWSCYIFYGGAVMCRVYSKCQTVNLNGEREISLEANLTSIWAELL